MENQYIQKISNINNINYTMNNKCNCCKCITSFCYCSCQCNCHNENMKKNNNNINYDELPNLNIDEFRMKSLNEYTSINTLNNTKKILNSSRSMYNIDNYRMNENNRMNFYTLEKRNKNNLTNFEYINKSQEENYFNNNKKFNIIHNSFSERNKNYTLNNHYKTQTNFNNLRKYYQLNKNNKKDHIMNNTFKTQLKLNKLLSNIKKEESNIKNKKLENPNVMYNTYVSKESSFPSKINNSENNLNNIINNSDNLNNNGRKAINDKNMNLTKYNEFSSRNYLDFGFNTEYNKKFRSLNFTNKSIDLNEEKIILSKDNKNSILDKYSNSLTNNFTKDLDSNSIYPNGGGDIQYINNIPHNNNIIQKDKLNEEQKIDNNGYAHRLNNKYLNSLELSSINNSNLNNSIISAPKEINAINKSESINLNIKNNYSKTSLSTQIENNKNELLESKDINSDNFILTFGAKGNNDIKNIIASVKKELKTKNKKINGQISSDENINSIINDYKNLKKKYSPNRLFTGLQKNINDMNNKINTIQEKSNKDNQNTYSIIKSSLTIKGQINKNNNVNEINELKIELKEAKNKIDELTKIIIDYQKEINILKAQIIKLNRDSIDNSKINTINNISTSNNNSNKTKIGKDSFIIKIPESLIKRRMNKDKNSRNNYSNEMTNRHIKKIQYNESNTLLDLTSNTYKKILFKNNSNNFNNISNISNNTNSNCLTINNISNNNINNYTNNEIYTKKITTTMKKKIKKSASQKIRINKINQNLYVKPIDTKRDSKFIYTILSKDDNVELLSFDVIKHRFYIINFIDFDNFESDFKESYDNNKKEYNSIFLNIEKNNSFYIITGKNCDKLYKYNNETNCIKKLCKLKNNHSNGCLLYVNDNVICLSGNHNKKVEAFSEKNNSLTILPEMNIERSYFSCCLIKNEYVFSLFGYNFPTQQYLDSIEFYNLIELENYKYNYININDNEWRYLKYNDNNSFNLAIKGHLSFNYYDEKIIFFGGFDGYNNEVVDCIYQLNLPENLEENNEDIYIEPLGKKLTNINKNKIYNFGNNTGILLKYKRNNIFLFAFDNNFNAHIIDTDNFKHNIHYFK